MPTFVLKCISESCGEILETNPMCRYSQAIQMECPICGAKTILQPQVVRGKVNGYSEENGYSTDEIMYDGSTPRPF